MHVPLPQVLPTQTGQIHTNQEINSHCNNNNENCKMDRSFRRARLSHPAPRSARNWAKKPQFSSLASRICQSARVCAELHESVPRPRLSHTGQAVSSLSYDRQQLRMTFVGELSITKPRAPTFKLVLAKKRLSGSRGENVTVKTDYINDEGGGEEVPTHLGIGTGQKSPLYFQMFSLAQ